MPHAARARLGLTCNAPVTRLWNGPARPRHEDELERRSTFVQDLSVTKLMELIRSRPVRTQPFSRQMSTEILVCPRLHGKTLVRSKEGMGRRLIIDVRG